jgi:hypothetical protein
VPPSQPPSSKSLDAGWGLFPELAQHEDDDETRTIQVSSPLFKGAPSFDEEDESQNERDTMPPPVPVAQYVQTMMEQAVDEPEPSARPLSSPMPFTWQNALPPSSRRGASSERALAMPAPRRVDSWSVPATLAPPGDNVNDDDDDEVGGFRLIAHEPERLGGARGDVDDPRFGRAPSLSPGFDDLPFDDVIAASERAAAGPRFPTPVPVLPSSRRPAYGAPAGPASSRREPPFPSIPPILGAAWGTPEPREAERPTSSPPTKRGISAEPPPPPQQRAHPGTQRYGSIGDASVLPKPPSTLRAPVMAPRPAPPPTPVDPFDDVRELFDAGDFRSALVMAEALLEVEPDHAQAKACLATCRETLTKKYLGRLGGLAKILRVAMPQDEIRWLSLDHKAGFLLSCIDGTSSIEEVLDVACMQQFEAIRILHDFRELGVIEILPDPRASRR